jgi:leader peptidase (prepilin peptidase)/N-methyltransferase
MRYSIIETITACVYLWLWMVYSPFAMTYAFAGMIFFALLLLGSMIDLDHMVLPDISTIGGMVIGVVLSCVWPSVQHVAPSAELWMVAAVHAGTLSVIGALVGSSVVFWIRELGEIVFKKEAMGYGDILLMGCIGAFCGWQGALFAIFGGAVIGLAVIVPWMAFAWAFRKPGTEPAMPTVPKTVIEAAAKAEGEAPAEGHPTPGIGVEIPFGQWLAIAGFLYYAWPFLHDGVNRYFEVLTSLALGEVPK